MLRSIDIKNVAVIENLSLEFFDGMTVLTGETGAGKSIIIDALNLALGARTSKELVRYGTKKAFVSACFDTSEPIEQRLSELGIDSEEDGIIISRELSADGKSTARINGVMVTANTLRELSELLLNIHGQQDSGAILNSANHADYLDEYASDAELLAEYREKLAEMKEIKLRLSELLTDEAEKLKRADLLKYQIDEIEKAELKPGEKEQLLSEREIVANGTRIAEGVASAYSAIYGDDGVCAYDAISTAERALGEIAQYDKKIGELCARIADIKYALEDIVHELSGNDAEYNENYLNELEERLDTIEKLEKKYGGSVEAVLRFYENASCELSDIQNSDEISARLTNELKIAEEAVRKAGKRLSDSRGAAAKRLSEEIQNELSELDMEKAVFKVSVEPADEFLKNGTDRVEFLISVNPGDIPKPLVKVASGGELSRTMLAIKSVLSCEQAAGALIFDEIDTGVSGRAAQRIAAKLWKLARKNQVICISHQPQLAAFSDNHYYIEKEMADDSARTTVKILDKEQRKRELARIIDGGDITSAALEHAAEMIASAERKKEQTV